MKLPFTLSGEVVRGSRLGRELGFPTANIALADNRLENGVYAVRAAVDGTPYGGVANAGTRPTVTDARERFLEVYLFDFQGELYGETMDVEFVAFLRPERKFASIDALRRQIERDRRDAEKILTR